MPTDSRAAEAGGMVSGRFLAHKLRSSACLLIMTSAEERLIQAAKDEN